MPWCEERTGLAVYAFLFWHVACRVVCQRGGVSSEERLPTPPNDRRIVYPPVMRVIGAIRARRSGRASR